MDATSTEVSTQQPKHTKQIVSWGLWDWGSAAFNAVIVTFVFTPVYLQETVGQHINSSILPAAWISYATAAAGLVIALMAPIAGQRADAGGRRKRSVGLWTTLVVVCMLGLFFVTPTASAFWYGLLLLGLANIFFEFAEVSYNAMIKQISRPDNIGKVSGFGWGMGYLGGIVLLLIIFFGMVSSGNLLGLSTENGFNFRLSAVVAAVWFAVFALPLMFTIPEIPDPPLEKRASFFASYVKLWREIKKIYAESKETILYLVASAIFRDALAAIFVFGAILAYSVYGLSADDIIIFGIASNVVAAIGAFIAGYFEDRIGPKIVIVISLLGLIASATTLLFLEGPQNFWIFGLILCLFVGPAQASARALLGRFAKVGQEGQLYGLYATTGRAVSFVTPALFGLFVSIFHAERFGILGIIIVLAAGLLVLLPIKTPGAGEAR